nr:tetratricopeptide repeat protein [uncultured Desulfobulbus sp.]
MQKIKVDLAGVLLIIFCLHGALCASVFAGDCDALKANIPREHNFIKRRALLRQAVETCNADAELYYQLGRELERSRKYDQALEQYRRALELNPEMARVHGNMGDIFRSQKKLVEAIHAYQSGLSLDPKNSRLQKKLEAVLKAVHEEGKESLEK